MFLSIAYDYLLDGKLFKIPSYLLLKYHGRAPPLLGESDMK